MSRLHEMCRGQNPRRLEKAWVLALFFALTLEQRDPLFSAPRSGEGREEPGNQQASSPEPANPGLADEDYRIGTADVLDISVFEAPDLSRTVRVSASGEITFPPLGVVKVSGLTSRQAELALEALLKRTYVKSPHVVVFIKDMVSKPVFVFGMVGKPGTYQVRGGRSLIELLSMAGGILDSAGDSVIVVRGANLTPSAGDEDSQIAAGSDSNSAETLDTVQQAQAEDVDRGARVLRIDVKDLLESGSSQADVTVRPGDVVSVPPPLVVYVVGDVGKPGGFPLKNHPSLWQIMALAGGPNATASKGKARIIRVNSKTGERSEIPVNLSKVLLAKSPGPAIEPNDIVYVPSSNGKRAVDRAVGVGMSATPGMIIALSPKL